MRRDKEHDVAWFDVAVYDTKAVDVLQTSQYLSEKNVAKGEHLWDA